MTDQQFEEITKELDRCFATFDFDYRKRRNIVDALLKIAEAGNNISRSILELSKAVQEQKEKE